MSSRRDVLILTALAVAALLACAAGWIFLLRYPADGVRIVSDVNVRQPDRLFISVQPGSPAYDAAMRSGDTVFRIDGIDVFETARLRAHYASPVAERPISHYIIYTPDGPARIAVRRQPAGDWVPWRASLLVNLLAALPYLCVGMYTHWKRPGDRRARLLNSVCLLFVIICLAPKELFFAIGDLQEPFPVTAFLPIIVAVAALLHFALIFPRDHALVRRLPWLVPMLYVVPIGAYAIELRKGANAAGLVAVVTFPLCLAASAIVLATTYRRSIGEEKRQIRWPLWGLFIAVAASLLSTILQSNLFAPPGHREIIVGVNPFFFLVVPITVAIAIFKYRLFDIDTIVRRTITYTLVMVIVVALDFTAIAIAGKLLAATGGGSQNATILSTVFVAALFAPIRRVVQHRVDRHFARGRLDEAEGLRRINVALSAAVDLPSLYDHAAAALQQIFNSRTVVVFAFDSATDRASAAATVGITDEVAAALAMRAGSPITTGVVNLDRSSPGLDDDDSAALVRSKARLVVPVRLRDELLAAITFGPRLSDERYDESDERLASAIASQIALAIDNHRLRDRSTAEGEWHALDRLTRLVFVAASRVEGTPVANVADVVARVSEAIRAAGASLPDANLAGAVRRLIEADAVAIERQTLRILKSSWRTVAEQSRPLDELASALRRRIGAYEIAERIGSGGMGEVFRGINIHDRSVAALKLLPIADSGRTESRRRLEREGAIVSTLAHPNIVRVLERGEHDGRLYIAMELISGATLSSRIHESSWTAVTAFDVALQISSALAALHGAGVVHRDIKPSNIMITPEGRAVLLDFGLARDIASYTITGSSQIVGSLPYMSPEQLDGSRVDARSDVWSFSVVLYEMLARRRPWRATEPARLAIEIASRRVDVSALHGLANAALLAIVREGLEPSLDLRVRDGIELHRRLVHARAALAGDVAPQPDDAGDVPTATR
ncbi:MAG: eukaryotic-like serine/threonine-protein kinase [Acidobacteriota bacterium]|jgi:serine/threonine-protein kinase|nr:eukaryotic-like serine/threonine-protein kinase [Acidobacteriota bacterium]